MINSRILTFLLFFLPLYPKQHVLRLALGILNEERPLISMSIKDSFTFTKLDRGTRLLYWLCCVNTNAFSQILYNPKINQNILEPPFDTVFTLKTTVTDLYRNKQRSDLIVDQYFVFAGLCMASAFMRMTHLTNAQLAAREIRRIYCSNESMAKVKTLHEQLLSSQLLNHICQQGIIFQPPTIRFLDMLDIVVVRRIVNSHWTLQKRLKYLLDPLAGDNQLLEARVKSICRFFEALAKALNAFVDNCLRTRFPVERSVESLNMTLSPACTEVLYDLTQCKEMLNLPWIRMALPFISE